MSNTTVICPECFAIDKRDIDGMSSRSRMACRNCGFLFTPYNRVSDVEQLNAAIGDALGRYGIRYHA